MSIQLVPFTADRVAAVAAFNQRMADGHTGWGWYADPVDEWLPTREGRKVWREHYLAVEDDAEVRGAYALKPQEWLLDGEPALVTDWQGPVSEGLLHPRYAPLGLRMIRDMLKRYPLLYSWGHGGLEAAMLQLLVSLKWHIHETPFCLRVLHPFRFLRKNAYLRGSARNRLALDLLAWSGAGAIGLHGMHAALGLRRPRHADVTADVVPSFGDWADALWERCRGAYRVIALRDAATLNALLPEAGWPPRSIRLRVRRGGADLGWAVVFDEQLRGDPRFGDLRVGCVADGLALPEDAGAVVAAATRFLAARGVDMIGSNQAHPAWIGGFREQGYAILAGRRFLAMSPALWDALSPFDEVSQGLHLTNMDGHGPHGFIPRHDAPGS